MATWLARYTYIHKQCGCGRRIWDRTLQGDRYCYYTFIVSWAKIELSKIPKRALIAEPAKSSQRRVTFGSVAVIIIAVHRCQPGSPVGGRWITWSETKEQKSRVYECGKMWWVLLTCAIMATKSREVNERAKVVCQVKIVAPVCTVTRLKGTFQTGVKCYRFSVFSTRVVKMDYWKLNGTSVQNFLALIVQTQFLF